MTKRIMMALALVVGTAGAASAQASLSATASVASVAVEAGVQQDIIFPEGTPGGTGGSAIAATATAANAGGPQLGFVAYDVNNGDAEVQVAAPATLSDGTNTLAVSFQCGESDAAGTGLALGACATHALSHTTTGLERRHVWVGGSIAQGDIDAAAPSTYSGTVTLTLVP